MDWQNTASYVLSGLIIWGVGQCNAQMRKAAKWRTTVDCRLLAIEIRLGIKEHTGHNHGSTVE